MEENLNNDVWTFLSWALPTIIGGISALALWFQKVFWPQWEKSRQEQRKHEQDLQRIETEERLKQRDHERQQIEARDAADQSEEVALWGQMVQLQTRLMDQNSSLLDFVMTLATETFIRHDDKMVDRLKDVSEELVKVRYEMREIRTSTSILVGEAASRDKYNESLVKIPILLASMTENHEKLYNRVIEIIGEQG